VASAYDYPTIPGVVSSVTDRPYSSVAYAIGGQTLSAGGPAIELSGTTYSLQPSGGNVLVNGQSASVSTDEVKVLEKVDTVPQPETLVHDMHVLSKSI